MAAYDHETAIITQLWAVLEAHAPFTDVVKAGNRVKLNSGKADALKLNWANSPNDFPEVTIVVAQSSDSLYTLAESYAMRPGATFTPATDGRTCEMVFVAVIDIVHRDTNFVAARQLTAEIMTAIRKAGPSLGITAFRVQRIGPVTKQSRIIAGRFGEMGDAGGVRRITTSINLPVIVRAQTSELLT